MKLKTLARLAWLCMLVAVVACGVGGRDVAFPAPRVRRSSGG